MSFDFPGAHLSLQPDYLHIHCDTPVHTLSSAITGGGLVVTRDIINHHVDKNYRAADPVAEQLAFAREHGIAEPFVGLLTAVYIEKARTCTLRHDGLTVTAVVTAGVGNATCAGVSTPAALQLGTINIIILLDANLTPAAIVNAVITTTEAKTHVLLERGVRTPDGGPATGTSTDTVTIACTGRGSVLPYAGPITMAGSLIGRCVRQCLQEALA